MANSYDYSDDIFSDSRMSFGEHIEELRFRLLRALLGFGAILIGVFALDMLGYGMGWKNFGVALPVMDIIVTPVENQVRDFYSRQLHRAESKLDTPRAPMEEGERVLQKFRDSDFQVSALSSREQEILLGTPKRMPVILKVKDLEKVFGPAKTPGITEIETEILVYPSYIGFLGKEGDDLLNARRTLRTLSVQEPLVVYFKVALLCGFVIGSPWIFFQLWAFIAAGLYPHERAYVYQFLGPSVGLFLAGVFLCQFVVLPGAVRALLGFNELINTEPEPRLNEWLGFALLLPLVFGISFQTPLVMYVLNRLGIFSAKDYLSYWRPAIFFLALFAAIITPTPDAITMSYLFVPMFGLYMLGVLICYLFPPSHEAIWNEDDEQVAV